MPDRTESAPAEWRMESHSAEETRALAAVLGGLAEAGTVLLLSGDLGAGKTVVAQGVGRGLGVPGVVNSPTFVLVNEHLGGRLPLLHADLYRLSDAGEIAELALEEVGQEGVLVVEWPERSADVIAPETLHLRLGPGRGEEDRRLRWRAEGPRARALLAALRAAAPVPASV